MAELYLAAKAGIGDPPAAKLHLHARLRVDHMAHAAHGVARAGQAAIATTAVDGSGHKAQHGIAVFFIMKDNALHSAGNFNGIGVLQQGHVLHGSGFPEA